MEKENKPYTGKDKWIVSVMAGLLFFILALPYTFQLTSYTGIPTFKNGSPTLIGVCIHAVLFVVITRLLMQ